MSALVHLPYGQVLDACYEALRAGDSTPLKYVVTKLFANWAFRSEASIKKPARPVSIALPEFKSNRLPESPSLVVVTPAYVRNEQDHALLIRLLGSLAVQSVPPDHIIVVDDGSSHDYELDATHVRHLRLDENRGPATARNAGKAEAARLNADIIAFIDNDCIADEKWAAEIRDAFRRDPKASILSGITRSYNEGWLGEFHDLDGTLNGRRFTDSNTFCTARRPIWPSRPT